MQSFDLCHANQLSVSDAKEYIKQYFYPLSSGLHIQVDYEDEKPQETKVHSVSERKIGLVSDEKAKLLKIYDLVRKICKKNNNDNYKKLEKYFVNLNKKVH